MRKNSSPATENLLPWRQARNRFPRFGMNRRISCRLTPAGETAVAAGWQALKFAPHFDGAHRARLKFRAFAG
jgi:hypothetical protein